MPIPVAFRIVINSDSPVPFWEQVAAALRADIAAGTLAGRLPAESAMARRYGVSRDTVRRALAALAEDGLVVSSKGRGWYVVQRR